MIRPHTGLEIDGFTLGAKLHTGGFATIWEVTHALYRTPMVMKIPTILDGDDGPTIVGFEVEQMILPRLSGPHVPRVMGTGDFSVLPYIVTERLPGGSLLELFRTAPRPLSEVLETAARLAEALHALHSQHVIHLDLKPENVLQRPGGEMVLIDFGLSRHDQLPDLLAESFTIPMGTFPYIAPEQILRQRSDPRSDLFALGVMIYELATGRKPFGKPEKLKTTRARLWSDPPPPRAIRTDLPEWLQEIILHALEVYPAQRYQSAAQMAFDLAHPSQVRLTDRARKTTRDGTLTRFRRWRHMRRLTGFPPPTGTVAQSDRAPILLVAVDLSPEMEELSDRLRQSVKLMLKLEADARVACVNVLRTARIGLDQGTDEAGNNLHVLRLVGLKAWADEIGLGDDRLTCAVLEHPDPGQAIVDHARQIRATHVLMGARGSSTARRYLGSVSSQVVAEAPCSVTVIRLPQPDPGQAADAPAETNAPAETVE